MGRARGRLVRVAVAVGLLALTAVSCAAPDVAEDPAGLRVAATTTILGDLVTSIVGDAGAVDVLMEPGQDPHTFALSARQVQQLRQADLVVANGLGLEESVADVLENAERDGTPVLFVGEHLDPRVLGEDEAHADDAHADDAHADEEPHADDETHADDHAGEDPHQDDAPADDDDGHGHAAGSLDPHVWLDPVRMADAARVIAEHLAEVDAGATLSDQEWAERGERVAQEILAAHEDVERILSTIPPRCRLLVTDHDALGYLADRYDLEVIGTVIPGTSTQAAPSARGFAELAELLRETGAPAIFADTTASTRLAESLAAEVGRDIAVVTLHTSSLGTPGTGAASYTDLLRTDAQRIADALASC